MRQTLVVGFVSLCLAGLVWCTGNGIAVAQRPGSPANGANGADSLITHSLALDDGRQQITVIDGQQRSMAVYQVDPKTGSIQLKSVRNIHWDLQMEEFNTGGNPSPKDIRTLVEQR
jgi:hypothetical protein